MEMIEQINQAINYIEEHIEEKMDVTKIAESAYLSSYHFQRIFHVLTGVTVAEYIRNRRLTLAAHKLTNPAYTVTEAALQYGYESIDAFTRAFQRLHGVSPSAVKKGNVRIKAFARMSFQIMVTGKVEMNYRIVESEGYEMVGMSMETSQPECVEEEVAAFCDRVWEDGSHYRLNKIFGFERMHMMDGVHYEFKEDGNRSYMLGLKYSGEEVPDEYRKIHIPSAKWAVFELKADMRDPLAIHQLWKQIYMEWLPTAEFEQIQGPCIEKYRWEDEQYDRYHCEVWIPVQRRTKEIR
ncbi:MAG: AraC family transcriptional regulator [Lachnospiraceae bacterium]|nr:AraC family transcriptional regulator [Lachnospiraceae bacterium]